MTTANYTKAQYEDFIRDYNTYPELETWTQGWAKNRFEQKPPKPFRNTKQNMKDLFYQVQLGALKDMGYCPGQVIKIDGKEFTVDEPYPGMNPRYVPVSSSQKSMLVLGNFSKIDKFQTLPMTVSD